MPLETQAKVLRVLQEKTMERVGGNARLTVNARVVAATHRDLEAEVRAGRFRQDLYYRLKVVQIELPPLRDRVEDVPALAERFLGQIAERIGRPKLPLSDVALRKLASHSWPGNVRELRNVLEQAFVLASGTTIEPVDLPLDTPVGSRAAGSPVPYAPGVPFAEVKKQAIERFEREYLKEALRQNGGNISRTADALSMVRQSLQQKIRELGLREPGED